MAVALTIVYSILSCTSPKRRYEAILWYVRALSHCACCLVAALLTLTMMRGWVGVAVIMAVLGIDDVANDLTLHQRTRDVCRDRCVENQHRNPRRHIMPYHDNRNYCTTMRRLPLERGKLQSIDHIMMFASWRRLTQTGHHTFVSCWSSRREARVPQTRWRSSLRCEHRTFSIASLVALEVQQRAYFQCGVRLRVASEALNEPFGHPACSGFPDQRR